MSKKVNVTLIKLDVEVIRYMFIQSNNLYSTFVNKKKN